MLYVYLFEHLHLLLNTSPWPFAARPRTHLLFTCLILRQGKALSRPALASLLWPDSPDDVALSDLRRHLYDLDRSLPPVAENTEWILRDTEKVQWNPDAPYWLDVDEFERLSAIPHYLPKAEALYTGDLLPQIDESWVDQERERLRQIYLSTLRQLVRQSRVENAVDQGIEYALKALAYDPLSEDVARELMMLYYGSGRRAEALQSYQALKQNLDAELATSPSHETRTLYENILDEKPLTKVAETIFSIRPSKHNLPAAVTTFVEREQEIAMLRRILIAVDSPVRLVTLVGAPGIGKTRLAVEACRSLLRNQSSVFPDGIYFVDLSPITTPDQVLRSIASVLDVVTKKDENLQEALKRVVGSSYMLLILDNFEHVLEASVVIAEMLAAAPRLRIVVTSRTPLKLYGEYEFEVPPLAVPNPGQSTKVEDLRTYGAIALFEERARQRKHAFAVNDENSQTIAEICYHLEGLPLSIELAAAQVQTLSLAQVLQQMDRRLAILKTDFRDVPERHLALRTAIGWSYELLDKEERQMFRQLAVFSGGWSLESAGAVCDLIDRENLLGHLENLKTKNLVQQSEGERYRMLATIREYALEELSKDRMRNLVYQRHANHFAAVAEAADAEWYGDQIERLLSELRAEEANLRAALEWSLHPAHGADPPNQPERSLVGVRIAMALNQYWKIQGRLTEGRSWLEQALLHRQDLPVDMQIKLIGRLASSMQRQGDFDQARAILEDALAIARKTEDPLLIGKVLHDLGSQAGMQANYKQAEPFLLESSQLKRQAYAGVMNLDTAATLSNLALVYMYLEKYVESSALMKEVLQFHRDNNADIEIAATLTNLGNLAHMQSQLDEAEVYYHEALQILYKLDDQIDLCDLLLELAALAFTRGSLLRSARLYGFSKLFMTKISFNPAVQVSERLERHMAELAERLGIAQLETALAEGAAMTLDETVPFILGANRSNL